MPIKDYADGTVLFTWTDTTEYSIEDDFGAVAKALGVTPKKLAEYLDDGRCPDSEDFTDATWKRLREKGDVQCETTEVDELEATGIW